MRTKVSFGLKKKLSGLLISAIVLLSGLPARGQTYYQVSAFSGTETDGGVTVTVTPTGSDSDFSFCFGNVSPYFADVDGASVTYTFSSPVASVQIPVDFINNSPFMTATYFVNGSFFPLTSVNLIGMASGECTMGLAEVSGGLLDNAVVPNSPSGVVQFAGPITSIMVIFNIPSGSNEASYGMLFAPGSLGFDNGSPQTSLICQNADPKSISSLLATSDLSGGTLTWSVVSGPSHGILSGFPVTAATGTNVTPSGTSYQPTAGYTGTDAYTIQVSDGANTATTTVNVVVGGTSPAIVDMWGGGGYCFDGTGLNVGLHGSAVGINYQLYFGGIQVGSPFAGIGYLFSFGLQTVAGTYTATATDPVSGCTVDMSGSENVIIYPLPNVYEVTGGGGYCSGGSGVTVGLSNSDVGVNYQLYLGGIPLVGTIVAGTGAAISFGLQAVAGTYTVVATTGVTACISNMSGSATIVINTLPAADTVTGGGAYCFGGAGVHVGTNTSTSGVNYQLYLGTVPIGSAVAGTGTTLDFGLQTSAGSYSAVATDATTGCTGDMENTVSVSINTLPALFTMTGGGSYCTGGTGVSIGLIGSSATVNYQLYNGSSPVGSPVTGTGAGLIFGLQTVSGTYTVVGTSTLTGCVNNMTGSAVVSTSPLPAVYTVIGGGGYCSGGTGVHVGLASSATGVRYQLWRGATGIGSPLTGTGSALDFGLQATVGTYSVTATVIGSLCNNSMSGSATVSVNSLPTVYAVTGGGTYCTGGTGVIIGLSNSQSGVNYQLIRGTTPIGSAMPGTGTAINFGLQSTTGTYTVVATNAATGCISNMTGSATVSITALPAAFNVTGGGNYCSGGTGVSIGLSGSQVGVNYQLFSGTTPIGTPISGTGAALTFGLHTTAGTYTIVATSSIGCANNMTGSATITINALPTIYTVTGGGNYCSGGTGMPIGTAGSNTGINYQLLRGTTIVGSSVTGTGSPINFGLQTITGTYTVAAKNTATSCASNMTGSATVSVSSVPTVVAMTGGGGYCSGSTGVHIGLAASVSGTTYQLYRGGSPVGSPISGMGAALDFGLQTTAGTYTATAANGSCTSNMSGSATVSVYAVPTTYYMTGGGRYCSGGSGIHVGLGGSNSGTTYKLYCNGTPVGSAMSGTGLALDFGLETTVGLYTVVATNSGTGCTSNMLGSDSVNVNPNPTVTGSIYTVAPTASITYTGSISGGSWTSAATSIATAGLSTGVITGVSLGTTTITYTLTTGCYGHHTVAVTPTGHRDANTTQVAPVTGNIGIVTVAPNPNHGTFTVKGTLNTTDDQDVSLQVTNMLGQVVYTNKVIARNGEIDETILLGGNLPNGMYLLSIRSETDTKVVHIVVEQ